MCCAGILCRGVDMSPGISSAHAQVSLSDLYEHPHSTAGHAHMHTHTHTHTLTSLILSSFRHTNTFLWASKINTADSRLTRRTHVLPPAKRVLTPTFFIKLRTPHICETLWSEIENTSCISCWQSQSIWSHWSLCFHLQKVLLSRQLSRFALNVKCWASVWVFVLEKKGGKDYKNR